MEFVDKKIKVFSYSCTYFYANFNSFRNGFYKLKAIFLIKLVPIFPNDKLLIW